MIAWLKSLFADAGVQLDQDSRRAIEGNPCGGCRNLQHGHCVAEQQFYDFSCREPVGYITGHEETKRP